MAEKIYMPKNGMDMTEGTIVRWLKAVGDPVEKDEPIMEIETDKVTMEAESPVSGTLLKQLYHDGDVVPVLTVVGYVGEPGETAAEVPVTLGETPEPERPEKTQGQAAAVCLERNALAATPRARKLAAEQGIDLQNVVPTGRRGEIRCIDVEQAMESRPKATGLAREMAAQLHVDLRNIKGSGFANKIMKRDVEALGQQSAAAAAQSAAEAAEGIPMNAMRKTIAKRMLASHSEIPPVTQCTKVDVTELLKLREKVNSSREKSEKLSVNDFVLKAVSMALQKHPRFCMSLVNDHFIMHEQISVGMAVALDEGLVVPVIRDMEHKSLSEISREAKTLAKKSREGKLAPQDMGNACVTVSNLGMFGTYLFTPIINQPEAGIIGVCTIEDELALQDGDVVVRKKMMICVTYDHRIMNGVESSVFQCEVKRILENPIEMLQ